MSEVDFLPIPAARPEKATELFPTPCFYIWYRLFGGFLLVVVFFVCFRLFVSLFLVLFGFFWQNAVKIISVLKVLL